MPSDEFGPDSATLSPTALVNEAWLKLRESPHVRRGLRRAGFTGGWLT